MSTWRTYAKYQEEPGCLALPRPVAALTLGPALASLTANRPKPYHSPIVSDEGAHRPGNSHNPTVGPAHPPYHAELHHHVTQNQKPGRD